MLKLRIVILLCFTIQSQSLIAQRFLIADSNNLWGITDRKGNYIIQPEHDSIKEWFNNSVDIFESFFILYKKNKKGFAVQDYYTDSARKSKYFLTVTLPAEYDSFKVSERIVFAYKKGLMAVYGFLGEPLFTFDTIRSCCAIGSLGQPNIQVLKSPIVYSNEYVYNKSTGEKYPLQTEESIRAIRKEMEKKKKKVERMHKRNHKYPDYRDFLLMYGDKCYRVNYGGNPKKVVSVEPVKLSKIMKEEVNSHIYNFCTTQFDKQNTY